MSSEEILKLHYYFLEKFQIAKIPLCAIEMLQQSLSDKKIDVLYDYIEKDNLQVESIIKKYMEDESLLAYAILKYATNNT